jgi:hypothetical protein
MQSFSIGDVFSKSAEVFLKNIVSIAILAVVVLGIPAVLAQAFVFGPMLRTATVGSMGTAMYAGMGAGVFSLILQLFLMSAICYCVVQSMAGRQISLGEMASRGVAAIPVTIGITLIFILVLIPSVILLYIPFIIVGCMWWVAVPVAIAERPGMLASLKRSSELTKGSRWKIFGLMVIYILVSLIISGLLMTFLAAGNGFSVTGMMQASQQLGKTGFSLPLILSQLFSSLLFAFVCVVVAVCYTELRRIKEGAGIADVAKIFS